VKAPTSSSYRVLEGGVDAVGDVGEYAFGGHAEGGGDQFGVEVVDQVDQSGGAEPFGRTLAGPSRWLKK
jgi:hypothetical protein